MIPDGRSYDYSIFRACERFGVRPPGIKETWDDMSVWDQARLMAYDQIRRYEDTDWEVKLAGGK